MNRFAADELMTATLMEHLKKGAVWLVFTNNEGAMPGQNKTLEDLFLERSSRTCTTPKGRYSLRCQKAKAANPDRLRAAFEKHAGETDNSSVCSKFLN